MDVMWSSYQDGKQPIAELAERHGVSQSTSKRRLREVEIEWEQPPLSGSGFVHLDTTYWGHNWGVMLGLDDETGFPLYVALLRHERVQDYVDAVRSIEQRGYHIRGIVVDEIQSLFAEFSAYRVQMCQFHMQQIVMRYLTKRPKLIAAGELKDLVGRVTILRKDEFEDEYRQWKAQWWDMLNRRSTLKSGKTQFTHKRLRSAMRSVDFYLPYLFTYQLPECRGMPNTNNKIEGVFTALKNSTRVHSGIPEENRKRFISGFFLALKSKLEREG